MGKEVERNPRKALGKGLSALLPVKSGSAAAAVQMAPEPSAKPQIPEQFENFQNIPLDQISPGGEQPRTIFDEESLKELAESIKANGVIQPITVQRVGPQKYKIIAGERRWKASLVAGLETIPALVRTADEQARLELALIENIQREDLNPLEIASAFQRLAEDHGLSHEEIAERTGKERSTVTNFLRLLRLSPSVRDKLRAGEISMGHARALLAMPDEEIQVQLCEAIISQALSVRGTENLLRRIAAIKEQQKTAKKREAAPIDPNVRAALDEMSSALGTKVKLVARSATSGRLEIEYYSQEDLDRIYSVIVKE